MHEPKHFIIRNNGYCYEAWYERLPDGSRRRNKIPIHDDEGKPVKDRDDAVYLLKSRANGRSPQSPKTTIDEFMPAFEQYLREKDKKESSIAIYRHNVFSGKTHLPLYMQDITSENIEAFISSLDVAPATKSKYAKSLSRFFKVAVRKGVLTKSPLEGYEFPKYVVMVNPYNESEITRLIKAGSDLEKETNEHYYALVMLALQAGMRLDEYVNMRWKYLDAQGHYTICSDDAWRSKHDHKRRIKIPKTSFSLISRIPRVEGCEYIFHNSGRKHHHFTRDFSNNIFKVAGIQGDLHQIRKTCASYRLACGQSIQEIKVHLGHKSLKELEAYIGTVGKVSKEMRKIFGEA